MNTRLKEVLINPKMMIAQVGHTKIVIVLVVMIQTLIQIN